MYGKKDDFRRLAEVKQAGLWKEERYILGPQAADISVEYPEGAPKKEVINFCANNYLGLSSHPRVIEAAHEALKTHGYGMSSVRFICGTQDIHRELEKKIAKFFKTEDTILYCACFDANGGLFEPFFKKEDAIITDSLNHASIIDGIRLTKAARYIYQNNDMADLEAKLKEAKDARYRVIATDGAFSMDGTVAQLDKICDLADKYDALVMVDDCHCTGFMGKTGRGSTEYCNVMGRVDIITGTLGKALGGASGGFPRPQGNHRDAPAALAAYCSQQVADRSKPLTVFDMITESTELRDKVEANTKRFRKGMKEAGFDIKPGDHPIVPIMLYNAKLSQDIARDMYAEGVFVIGFFYPVVGKGLARIRCQMSAAHEFKHIDKAVEAFTKVGKSRHSAQDKDNQRKYGEYIPAVRRT
jgi:glycine C-acetyltransferase